MRHFPHAAALAVAGAMLVFAVAHSTGMAQAQVQAPQPAPVSITNAWARATPPRASTGALYLTLTSPAGDALTGASSPAADKAELHQMSMNGNVMIMRPVENGLALPAGKPVTLAPNGTHIMLTGLRTPLKQGQTVMLHLTFRHAPPEDVTVPIESIGASAAPGAAGQAKMPTCLAWPCTEPAA